jgi:serine/threonine-protein kinase HipA
LPDDKNLFAFNQDYIDIDAAQRPTLSLSFKDKFGGLITNVKPTQTRVPAFFANLLPEGEMREYLAKRAGVNPKREFFLLWVLGRDLPGAVEILPADGEAWPEEAAKQLETAESGNKPLRFSLAGVQLKFSAIKNAKHGLTVPVDGTGGSWIVKLPSATYKDVPENEYAMMELARRVGIDVPETSLIPISEIDGLPDGVDKVGEYAYAIRRFDRGPNGERIHIEDFAQVFGVYPEEKYSVASYRNLAEVVWTETGEVGIAEFIRRLVFNALIGNGDMHLKNWSLVYPKGRDAAVAPAYDLVSTIPYIPGDRLALGFIGFKDFAALTRDNFKRFAGKAGLPEKLVLDTAAETTELFGEAWTHSKDVPAAVREAVDKHLSGVPSWQAFATRTVSKSDVTVPAPAS